MRMLVNDSIIADAYVHHHGSGLCKSIVQDHKLCCHALAITESRASHKKEQANKHISVSLFSLQPLQTKILINKADGASVSYRVAMG